MARFGVEVASPPGYEGPAKPAETPVPRRGRGRPRKDWAATTPDDPSSVPSSPSTLASSTPESLCGLNVRDCELLIHFVSSTGPSFVSTRDRKPDDPIVKFWTHNVPRIGLSHHFVLHLMFAVAGLHLAYLRPNDPGKRVYEALARDHLSTGLAEMTESLGRLDGDSHGALYVGATLVCYCTFAAGPIGRSDLLLCDVDGTDPARWIPLIRGLKHVREAADPAKLWAGLMSPLAPSGKALGLSGPTFARDGFPKVDWVSQFEDLRELIAQTDEPDRDVYSRCFESLRGIYAATYGDSDGRYDGPPDNQFVHGWLYRIENGYVASLRRKEPLALILLAHFALLLRTMKDDWFMDGWMEHLLSRTREYIPRDLEHWVRWPTEQAGMPWGDDGIFS